MEDCIKYCIEIKDLMVYPSDAIEDKNVEKAEEIIETCRCALNDIQENLSNCDEDYDDEEDEDK